MFDAMKMFAIINMTVDHIGAYLFPEIAIFRAIGRITFPVWFFLVGYSLSRKIPISLWVYALLLACLHPFVSIPIFPINALLTIIMCRLMLNFCTDYGLLPKRIPELIVLFMMLAVFTTHFSEYGTMGFLFALFGRMVREKQTVHFKAVMICSYVTFVAVQLLNPRYNIVEAMYIILGTAWVVEWLSRCPKDVLWEDWRGSKFKTAIVLLTRNTLPYYFYHRAFLQILGALLIGSGIGFSIEWITWR